ncbi:MAG: tetratricopeptide repeat protein [bacterium]
MLVLRQTTRLGFAFLVALMIAGKCVASESDTHFKRGNEFYEKGEYGSAIAEYEQILQSGYEGWEVYFNLGNAYFKQGELGEAILNFERARKLNPDNEDIEFNLDLVNLSVVDRVPQLPQFFVLEWISKFVRILSLNTLGIVTIVAYLLWTFLIILRLAFKRVQLRRFYFVAILISSTVFFVLGSTLALRIFQNETDSEAILLAEKVDVKSAPGSAGTDLFTLHEGVKVSIQDRSGDWLKIKLADGKVGWLLGDAVEQI